MHTVTSGKESPASGSIAVEVVVGLVTVKVNTSWDMRNMVKAVQRSWKREVGVQCCFIIWLSMVRASRDTGYTQEGRLYITIRNASDLLYPIDYCYFVTVHDSTNYGNGSVHQANGLSAVVQILYNLWTHIL